MEQITDFLDEVDDVYRGLCTQKGDSPGDRAYLRLHGGTGGVEVLSHTALEVTG